MATPRVSDHLAIALASGAGFCLQIALTRVLSITLWHHFAFLVVGLALLGFGVAGSWLAWRGGAVREGDGSANDALARRSLWAAAATATGVMAALCVRPNALMLLRDSSVAPSLALIAALLALPFVGAGAVIGTALSCWSERAATVYAADLVGGGLAAAGTVWAITRLGAMGLVVASVWLLLAASLLFALGARRGRRRTALGALLVAALSSLLVAQPDAWIVPAPTKELAVYHRIGAPRPWVEHRAWTPHGRVDVGPEIDGPPMVAGEVARIERPWRIRFVTQDGAAPTTMHQVERDPGELTFLKRASTSAVYALMGARFGMHQHRRGRALIIGVGGGVDVMAAVGFGARQVTGVEINPALLALLTDHYPDFVGRLAERPEVRLVQSEGRAFVRQSRARYDAIVLSGVDTFTALASGAYSLAEAHLYTLEAFEDYLAHLSAGGCLQISRLILEPPRETLRLAVSAAEAMRRSGDAEPWRRIAVVRGRMWATLLACRRAIAPARIERLRRFAADTGFRLVFDPLDPRPGPFASALVGDTARFVADYPFHITPARDEAPFFFDFFRWRSLVGLDFAGGDAGLYATPLPVGHGVQLVTLLVTLLLAALGILYPVRRDASRSTGGGAYFALLGAAFIVAEVAFIQRLTFFVGDPTSAMSVVLAGLLVASGIGSALTRKLLPRAPFLPVALALLGAAGLSYLALPRLIGLPFGGRLAVAVAMVAVAGVGMGMPFVWGIGRLREAGREAIVPWAFAVNAFATVVAASAAPLVAVEIGFSSLLVLGALCYLAAWRAARSL